MRFYVYLHTKPTGEVFYVGKGCGQRAWSQQGRSPFWYRTVEKYPEYEVRIVARGMSEADALDLERYLISYYGKRTTGGTLCNLADGGEGSAGYVYTPMQRQRIRDRHAARRDTRELLADLLPVDALWESDYAGHYI